jgi:polyhydroxyalkanoate synthesis regulator phasin
MNEKNEDPFGMASMANIWLKSMGDLWGNMADQWVASQKQQETSTMGRQYSNPKAQAALEATLKNFKAITGVMATPESLAALLKGSGTMPEVLLKLSQSSLSGFFEMQQKMLERFGRLGESAEAYTFQDIDENIFRAWTDTYEKEFKQIFKIPQLGLMRNYQEKANLVADKYNLFQSTLSEFLCLLALPFNKTLQVMQEKLTEMAEGEGLPEETREYYDMWVKVLEGHYMTLFQTPEYTETLARTINTLADFSAARNAALEDLLDTIPVAKQSDMDDMARELYEVKKRIRKLEKEQTK